MDKVELLRLSEKGSERGLEGGFGCYEEAEMGRKEPSQRSLGPRRGRFRGFSDSFRANIAKFTFYGLR
jgi:hypothetical protein